MEVTATETTAWYIEAWAVHDGKVFASKRPAESIEADATVFMSVPDLGAVPVGRISTALRATRSGFQEGLRTADGAATEVPFENLAQIRELVRRAYLAAGLGPEAPGAIAGPLPRPETGPGGGSGGRTFLENESVFRRGGWMTVEGPDAPVDLPQAVDRVALATLLEWDRYLTTDSPEEIRGLVGWIGALIRSGVLSPAAEDPHDAPFPSMLLTLAGEFDATHLARVLRLVWDRWMPNSFSISEPISGYWSRGHLASVPLPAAPGWHPLIRRLADMYLLPQVDARFWTSARAVTSLDIAPLALVHAIRQPPRAGRLPGEPSVVEAAHRRAWPSMTWYERGLLPAAAEEALARFIDRCLEGPTTGQPGPASAQHPSAPGGSGSEPVSRRVLQVQPQVGLA